MKIRISGNGGAINDGLPYNSFLIDEKYLIEAPPDIMNSLFRDNIDISGIQLIYISHFHGDHYFGLPFLTLRLFFNSVKKQAIDKIKILGPQHIKSKTQEICRLAVGENHPLNEWIEKNIFFIEVTAADDIIIDGDIKLKFFPMAHFTETLGFSLYENDKILLSYFADTLWDDTLIDQIRLFPKAIIADLNGELSDPVKIHLSESDIIAKALPVSKDKTVYYGTHLKYQKESSHKYIKYVYPGEVIELQS